MNRIRSLRKEAGMSQKELAARLGVKGGAVISKYEKEANGLSADTLRMLSLIFDVSVDYILGISDEKRRGTSLSAPHITWDALALVESADALAEGQRATLLACAKNTEALSVAARFLRLSAKSRKRVDEYLDMLRLADEAGRDGRVPEE